MGHRKYYLLNFGIWYNKQNRGVNVKDMDCNYIFNVCAMVNLSIKEWVEFLRMLEILEHKEYEAIYSRAKDLLSNNVAYFNLYNKRDEIRQRKFDNQTMWDECYDYVGEDWGDRDPE